MKGGCRGAGGNSLGRYAGCDCSEEEVKEGHPRSHQGGRTKETRLFAGDPNNIRLTTIPYQEKEKLAPLEPPCEEVPGEPIRHRFDLGPGQPPLKRYEGLLFGSGSGIIRPQAGSGLVGPIPFGKVLLDHFLRVSYWPGQTCPPLKDLISPAPQRHNEKITTEPAEVKSLSWSLSALSYLLYDLWHHERFSRSY